MKSLEQLELELLMREAARRSYPDFVSHMNPGYDWQKFHRIIAEHLDRFEKGLIKKLMITVPPQHGKSELSTRNLPPYLFGKKPSRKLAVLSFSASKARKFNREIQLKMNADSYRSVFPSVKLPTAKDDGYVCTMEVFDIVGTGGSLKAVGKKGPITGDPVDIAILDDLMKDGQEAQSPKIREFTWDWIEKAVETRLHNDSQMLYVTTRWHEDDPSGRFLKRDGFYSKTNPDGWVLLNFEAIKTNNVVPYDDRPVGSALWPAKHSLQRMQKIKDKSPETFNALYQGDPKPSNESLIFGDWIEIDEFPEYVDHEFNVLDFGFSNDPTALVHVGRTGKNLYLDEYIYETGLTNQDIIKLYYAVGLDPSTEMICDKAEPKSIEELNRGYYDEEERHKYQGLNAKGCEKGPGSVNAGILKLKEFNVHYTKRSLNIKQEKNNYTWIMSGGKATNVPIDDWNHAIDGIRSGVFTKYSKPAFSKPKVKVVKRKRSYFS